MNRFFFIPIRLGWIAVKHDSSQVIFLVTQTSFPVHRHNIRYGRSVRRLDLLLLDLFLFPICLPLIARGGLGRLDYFVPESTSRDWDSVFFDLILNLACLKSPAEGVPGPTMLFPGFPKQPGLGFFFSRPHVSGPFSIVFFFLC